MSGTRRQGNKATIRSYRLSCMYKYKHNLAIHEHIMLDRPVDMTRILIVGNFSCVVFHLYPTARF